MSDEHAAPVSRRRLLGGAAGLIGLSLAPGIWLVQARAQGQDAGTAAAEESPRWGLLVDTTRCSDDCEACVAACRDENGWSAAEHPASQPQWIRKMAVSDPLTGKGPRALPMMCQHCAHPPCVSVCPTRASFQRADGIVLVDKHRCIGCRYCVLACPFQARFLAHEPTDTEAGAYPRGKGTAEGCTLCVHRIDRGERPACVERCAAKGQGALIFGDLHDPDSEIRRALHELGGEQLRRDLELDPSVRYHGLA